MVEGVNPVCAAGYRSGRGDRQAARKVFAWAFAVVWGADILSKNAVLVRGRNIVGFNYEVASDPVCPKNADPASVYRTGCFNGCVAAFFLKVGLIIGVTFPNETINDDAFGGCFHIALHRHEHITFAAADCKNANVLAGNIPVHVD